LNAALTLIFLPFWYEILLVLVKCQAFASVTRVFFYILFFSFHQSFAYKFPLQENLQKQNPIDEEIIQLKLIENTLLFHLHKYIKNKSALQIPFGSIDRTHDK
jgi:hypothetical protein